MRGEAPVRIRPAVMIRLHALTGVVDLTTALPSSLWVVSCTWTPGFEEI